ncbi:MAG: ATP-binding protein, partial [Clostridiales bacterium]|nr:ATP-binding protein [Clostridiales bacterium]
MDFEKLGLFYLGREIDAATNEKTDNLLLYDAKDLTTHAMCVGMTGSGKTGLCVGLLEEAAMDRIPAIVVDPKGDMTNLLLSFPDMKATDFEPWVRTEEAEAKGISVQEYAARQAETWRSGLAGWGIAPERIRTMRETTEFALYTPGSSAGKPLSILKLLNVPAPQVAADNELMAEQVSGTASGLLSLIGIEADPLQSREHILIANILHQSWEQRQQPDLPQLIAAIQNPSFSRVGIMELEDFFPQKERFALALRFNNLLASPQFSGWLEGESLDIDNLLYTEAGKPKISILSISHLNDNERMFFVSLLLNQLVSWMRAQPGTSSLRALFYMDEIFGYFPPVANPPSKQPLLTLLKQARAYGLGIVLTTQNPVDLDYKALANIGTWFIGRLQTERDKARLLDGLEGAAVASGSAFDRRSMDALLSGLGKRRFLMNNVHEAEPVLFETRWTMSYLAGPLLRNQIRELTAGRDTEGGTGTAVGTGAVAGIDAAAGTG